MPTVSSEVICPRRGGVVIKEFDCRTYQASRVYMSCGYHARVGEREGDDLTLEEALEGLRPFAEWWDESTRGGGGWIRQLKRSFPLLKREPVS